MNEPKVSKSVGRGIFFAALASTLWGISGTMLQYVSQDIAIPAMWFIGARTLGAGVILIVISLILYGKRTFAIFHSGKDVLRLVMYAVFGLAANIYTFYISIEQGNASAATILQYLAPLFIVLWAVGFHHERPLRGDLIAFVLALIGVVLAITRGDIHSLAVPVSAIIWGILSGVTAAMYVTIPKPLVAKYPPFVVLGWGTLIASLGFNLVQPVWINHPPLTPQLWMGLGTVIVVGTVGAFGSLLISLQYAPESVVSIMDALQPVVTFILTIIVFHTAINVVEVIGVILVLIAVYVLQRSRMAVANNLDEMQK
ncbi:DMT family transporter [Lacticaseibacillus brantae]|uniref:DMT family permease n=1 Tax=Lacticaseibacillus brantae DSM 23927 TaxID=1423727 RepID=A0A0R2AX84_9LACO|nr:EamA family transporter [Lacticaseibacillus brantae]KRM71901.1 DMT family permease [Lacticaseibacillus brantae DSM 23927]